MAVCTRVDNEEEHFTGSVGEIIIIMDELFLECAWEMLYIRRSMCGQWTWRRGGFI